MFEFIDFDVDSVCLSTHKIVRLKLFNSVSHWTNFVFIGGIPLSCIYMRESRVIADVYRFTRSLPGAVVPDDIVNTIYRNHCCCCYHLSHPFTIYNHIHEHSHTHPHPHPHPHHTHTHTHTHTYTHARTHTHIHARTHTYTHCIV